MVTAEVACVILEGYSVCIMKKMCAQHMNSTVVVVIVVGWISWLFGGGEAISR